MTPPGGEKLRRVLLPAASPFSLALAVETGIASAPMATHGPGNRRTLGVVALPGLEM